MAEMAPHTARLRLANTNVFFQGERHTARFLSRYSLLHRARSGLYRIEYHVADRDGGGKQLLVNERPVRGVEDAAGLLIGAEQSASGMLLRFAPFERTAETRVLLDGLADCYFEYYRGAGLAGPGEWVAEWVHRANELPRAMAIRLEPRPGGRALRPVPIVAGIENYYSSLR